MVFRRRHRRRHSLSFQQAVVNSRVLLGFRVITGGMR